MSYNNLNSNYLYVLAIQIDLDFLKLYLSLMIQILMESINGLILSYLEVTFGNAIKYVVLWRYHFKTHRQVHEPVNNIQGVFLIL